MTMALAAVMAGTLGGEVLGLPFLAIAAGLASVAYIVLAFPRVGYTGRGFIVLAAGLAAALFASAPDAPGDVAKALARACLVVTLFNALGFLREAARGSAVVRRCGYFLTRQPPGRRYLALTLGGHLFGLVLSYGSISLLGTMSERANARERDPVVRRLRLRRMLLAIQRGFVGTLTWSPLGLSMAVTLATFPELSWEKVLPFFLLSGFILVVLGWALDRMFKPTGRASSLGRERAEGSWLLLAPIAGLVGAIFLGAILFRETLRVSMVMGVIVAVPLAAALWILWQFAGRGPGRAVALAARRLARHMGRAFPADRGEIVILWSAGFIGTLVASLLKAHGLAAFPEILPEAPWLLPVACLWLIAAAGQLGMNPILSVTILGSALPDLHALGLAPASVAVAFTAGWALSGASSPFTATTMLVGRIGGARAVTVGLGWNGVYTLLALVSISLLVAAMATFGP